MVGRYGVNKISFYDDLMIADHQRLEKLAVLIRKETTLSKVKFWINARTNLMTEETARLLSEIGTVSVGFGMESGNERTLRYLKGGSVSVEDNYNAVKILHKYGIAANASFIIGSPDETKEEILDTYNFIKTSGLDFVDVFVLTPFPGTPVWEYAKSIGVVQDDMDWDRLNIYFLKVTDPVLVSSRIGKEEMTRLYKKFQRQRLFFIAARRAWLHPFFEDMCIAGIEKVLNNFRRLNCSQQCQ
jgi:radical SAM superfamily enzyme YgiQ (UPF0313 family)